MALEKKFDKNALEMAAATALWFALHTIKIGPKRLWRNIIMFLRKNRK